MPKTEDKLGIGNVELMCEGIELAVKHGFLRSFVVSLMEQINKAVEEEIEKEVSIRTKQKSVNKDISMVDGYNEHPL